ncbi:hypothetical protein LEP1GSC125_1890 [Leptospira mayottensis 200901122]|uniref:Uncharacterized protein n=1 Tax=Leptospira mayottensis 200901122 TaxID=1193010 RepID=A0AA87MML9_9LEPT|nr:hypothetical protein LEP1GSC125_1890 [Leptospira mayottensis 200901122]
MKGKFDIQSSKIHILYFRLLFLCLDLFQLVPYKSMFFY